MQQIAADFTDGRFRYEQVTRAGMVALYRQTHRETGRVVGYEVVRLRIQAAHTWPTGVTTPEKEAYPPSTAWGRLGWTCFALPEAEVLFARLGARSDTDDERPVHQEGSMVC